MSGLPVLLAGLLLAVGVSTACEATGSSSGCRPAAAAAAVEFAPKPKPKKTAVRQPVCTKANSPIWQGFKPYRGDIRTNGKSGNKQRFYQWDATHGDIEVYDHDGDHLGSMDLHDQAGRQGTDSSRTEMTDEHHCERMDYAVQADDLALSYVPEYREWGIDYTDGGSSFYTIDFCPWDGQELPASLRHEWFRRMREDFGLDPGDPAVEWPEEMRGDRWWKEAGL